MLDQLFNWKKHPGSVFLLAIPLMIIGLGSLLLQAVLMAKQGDWGYLIIFAGGMVLLSLVLISGWRWYQSLARITAISQDTGGKK